MKNLKYPHLLVFVSVLCMIACQQKESEREWFIKSQKGWMNAQKMGRNIQIQNGQAISTEYASTYISKVKQYRKRQKAKTIIFSQTTAWDNWKEIPNIGVPEMDDAPVLISPKEGEYYLLAKLWLKKFGKKRWDERGDIANDQRPKSEMGYHAWYSNNMKNWKHCGPISGYRERWVTTAEYKNGKFYIYYDNPNDEDPHLIVDENLRDGKMGKDYGMVFSDPSHGSDCAVLRDEDDTWHLIYENWDPINAKTHSWDSPLGGHAISMDGIHDFKIVAPIIDERTTSTGKTGEFEHGSTHDIYKFDIHEPEQNAFGDWTAIKVGEQYYLFCDYDPVDGHMKLGRFTGSCLDEEFTFCGEVGKGHPDPTVAYAEGQFYLLQQKGNVDFVSPGPWVAGVEARVGIDTDGDKKTDQWTGWQEIKETYTLKPGFARVVNATPASLDLSSLPKGYGFCFEYRTNQVNNQDILVKMRSVKMTFE